MDVTLVRRLLAAQLPRWAGLPITPIGGDGTDNAIFRLGSDLAVRLPLAERSAQQIEKEHRWLPRLGPQLPLAIPMPLAKGDPAEGYPWPWGIYRWIDGETAALAPVRDLGQAAQDLGRFVAALQGADPAGGPPGGRHNGLRGLPLQAFDGDVRSALAALQDTGPLRDAWEIALQAPPWRGPGVWLHGDLHPANLLARDGRIHAVIDFGLLGVGDPAYDLMLAWTLLTPETRETFRAEVRLDAAAWVRGRGWALAWAAIAYAYYRTTANVLAAISRRTLQEVLA
ncbi:MAG TPA: aminoglycoside phosphotransferase family protein [Bacillota bacterium]|nr:aminoglycoside phosphotransferase family protein [Bacillota bacterium]